MSLFRLPTRSNFYVLTFSLQNERDNLEFLTEIFTYELTVIDESKEEKRLSIFNVEAPLYMLFPLMTFKYLNLHLSKWNEIHIFLERILFQFLKRDIALQPVHIIISQGFVNLVEKRKTC